MYRRGFKDNVKDKLIRDSRKVDNIGILVKVTIDLDDRLYERALERRYDSKTSRKVGYAPRYNNRRNYSTYDKPKGNNYYTVQLIELDAT